MDSFVRSLFKNSGSFDSLEVKLVKEYKRRSALWAEYLGKNTSWPFFDIADTLVGRGEASYDAELLEKRLSDLNDIDPLLYPKRLAESVIRWNSLKQKEMVNLPDPYLPLQLLFQRGCNSFYPEMSMIFFEGGGSINLSRTEDGNLNYLLSQEPWISEEEIAALQAHYP